MTTPRENDEPLGYSGWTPPRKPMETRKTAPESLATLRRELSARERETFVLRARVRVLQEKLDRATKVISMQQEKLEACDGD
jgi:hypothetical protein